MNNQSKVEKTINEWSHNGKISRYYDLRHNELDELYKTCTSTFQLACSCFVLGYARGYKASQAEARKKRNLNIAKII